MAARLPHDHPSSSPGTASLTNASALRAKHGAVTLAAVQHAREPRHNFRAQLAVDAVNYGKIQSLFEDPVTSGMTDRLTDVVSKLARVYAKSSIPQEHVSPLGKVIGLMVAQMERGVDELRGPFRELMEVCVQDLTHLTPTHDLVSSLCRALECSVVGKVTKREIVQVFTRMHAQEHLDLVSDILSCIHTTLPTLPDPSPLLKLLLFWSDHRAIQLRMTLLDFSPVLRRLLQTAGGTHDSPVIQLLCIQVAFRVLQPDREQVPDWLPVLTAVQDDFALTNDVLVLMHDMLKADKADGYYPDLVRFVMDRTLFEIYWHRDQYRLIQQHRSASASFASMSDALSATSSSSSSSFRIGPLPPTLTNTSSSTLALESKNIGFQLIDVFLDHPSARAQLLSEGQYIDFCVGYLTFNPQDGFDQGWTLRDLKHIQATCLAHLARMFAQCDLADEAENLSCDPVLVGYLRDCLTVDTGVADRPNAVNPSMGLLARVLHLVRVLASGYGEHVRVKLGAQGLVSECVSLLCSAARTSPAGAVAVADPSVLSDGIRRHLLVCLAALCDDNCAANQVLVAQSPGAVYCMVQMIPWTCAHPRQQELMRVAVLDAVWAVVCGCRLNEESLLEAGGVFKMLGLLELAAACDAGAAGTGAGAAGSGAVERSVVGHLLAVLVELLENPKTRQHVAMWSSSRFKCAGELLVGLWRRERSHVAFEKGVSAVDELRTNHCCKIFSILSHLGFNTFRHRLNEADQRLLLQIEGYLDLKIGIVWDEIKYELNTEGIRPVSPDQAVLDSVKDATDTKRQLITIMQHDVERKLKEAQAAAEHGFYGEFMRAHRVASLAEHAEGEKVGEGASGVDEGAGGGKRQGGRGGSVGQLTAAAGGKRHSVAFATLPELITTPRPPSSVSKASAERLANLSADAINVGGSAAAPERPQRPLWSPKVRLGT